MNSTSGASVIETIARRIGRCPSRGNSTIRSVARASPPAASHAPLAAAWASACAPSSPTITSNPSPPRTSCAASAPTAAASSPGRPRVGICTLIAGIPDSG
ncbi:MAG: hypothetical protein R3B68_03665 [Phycisphaerales bacterium]